MERVIGFACLVAGGLMLKVGADCGDTGTLFVAGAVTAASLIVLLDGREVSLHGE